MSNQSCGPNDMCLSDQMFKKIILEKLGSVFAREVSVCGVMETVTLLYPSLSYKPLGVRNLKLFLLGSF